MCKIMNDFDDFQTEKCVICVVFSLFELSFSSYEFQFLSLCEPKHVRHCRH